jgi:dihydrofolate reductase
MTLDGYIAGPNITPDHPMGRNGQRLHDWLLINKTKEDERIIEELLESSGAVILGGWTYTVAIDGVWESVSPFNIPAFVLCTEEPLVQIKGFSFVTAGIEAALSKARAVAGSKNVWVMGGANIAQQFIRAGILDELHLHIVPVLLARGTRLFENLGTDPLEMKIIQAVTSPGATHLYYRLGR